jgi:tRNA dimethylallyltransferase
MQISDQIAIIGPTASGKSALAVQVARKFNGIILSLDSLSVFRHIDIASAKPTSDERSTIAHYGIDVVNPDEHFDVTSFADIYLRAKKIAGTEGKKLIITGGTGFYLKMLLAGISPLPNVSQNVISQIETTMHDPSSAYRYLSKIDPAYADLIKSGDTYRIEKALTIYLGTGTAPSQYFSQNPPVSIIEGDLPIYEISTDKEALRKRIVNRTDNMLISGLIDEVCYLEKKYSRSPSPMKAIGIKEVLAYLDGIYDYEEMREKIITSTARLAKRQRTFNKSQFQITQKGNLEEFGKFFGIE